MLGMAVLADYLAVAIPEQILNFFIGTFTIYLVATAWMTPSTQAAVCRRS